MNKAKQKNTSFKSPNQIKPPTVENKNWLVLLIVISIACITFIVFYPSLKCGFVDRWDDQEYVTASPLVINNAIPVNQIFHTPISLNYHPLTILTLAYNYKIGKLNPMGYHLWNVWLHVLNTILVFLFVFLLTKRNLLMAAIVSLFFGIHPMHIESVTWVSERKDVLYVFFFLAGLISYLKFIEQKKRIWYLVTLVLFILSCLSKAMAVVFPIVLLLIDCFNSESKDKLPLWKRLSIINKLPFFIISLGVGIVAFTIQQNGKILSAMSEYSFIERIMFASYGLLMYMVKLIAPVNLSAFYAYPSLGDNRALPVIVYLAPFIVAGLFGMVYLFFRKEKMIVFGSLFYLITIMLVLQFVSVGNAIMADRYSYLSYIGLLLMAAHIVNLAFNKSGKLTSLKYPLVIVIGIAAAVFGHQTYGQIKVWTNTETLWTNAINIDPQRCYLGYFHRGDWYEKNKQFELAIADFSKLLEIDPSKEFVYFNRGACYSSLGKDSLALNDFDMAVKLGSSNADAYYNRGRILAAFGKDSAALSDYNKAIELNPRSALSYMNRGVIYYNRQQPDLAIADYNKAIEAEPTLDISYYNRGVVYYGNKQFDLALADFTKAIALNATVFQYWEYSALTKEALGRTEEAKTDRLKAQELNKH